MRVRPGHDLVIRHRDILRHLFKDLFLDHARRAVVIREQAIRLVELDLDPNIVGLARRLLRRENFRVPVGRGT